MIGGFISDLEKGDVFPSVSFVIEPDVAVLFANGFGGESSQFSVLGTPDWVPPTAVHALKQRLLRVACPMGDGPHPKLVTLYQATHHAPIPVGRALSMSGSVMDRFTKRGRTYLRLGLELSDATNGSTLVEYVDEQLLRFRADSE